MARIAHHRHCSVHRLTDSAGAALVIANIDSQGQTCGQRAGAEIGLAPGVGGPVRKVYAGEVNRT
jgi:hypothetical protein